MRRASSASGISAWVTATSIGTATSSPARSKSASTMDSSSRPPAIACRASTSKTIASSAFEPDDPIQRQLRPADRRHADRQGQPREAQAPSQPRPRPDHRRRDQPHRLHERRKVRALGRRRYGRRRSRARPRVSSKSTRAVPSSSTSRPTTSTFRACPTRDSSARPIWALAAMRSRSSTGVSARSSKRSTAAASPTTR